MQLCKFTFSIFKLKAFTSKVDAYPFGFSQAIKNCNNDIVSFNLQHILIETCSFVKSRLHDATVFAVTAF